MKKVKTVLSLLFKESSRYFKFGIYPHFYFSFRTKHKMGIFFYILDVKTYMCYWLAKNL